MIKNELKKQLEKSDYVRKPMEVDLSTGAEKRWDEKEILKSLLLFNPEKDMLSKTEKFASEIEKSDFVCPSTNHKSLMIKALGHSIKGLYPPIYSTYFKFDSMDLSEYNRVALYVYIDCIGYRNVFWNISLGDETKSFVKHDYAHDPSIETNKWVKIHWELGHISRKNIKKITITPFVSGPLPESCNDVKIYINDIVLEKVKPDYEEGWDLEDRIAYSHVGYLKNSEKIALAQNIKNNEFYLKNENGEVVYKNKVKKSKEFFELDFSDFKVVGEYSLEVDNLKTYPFLIDDNPYESSIWKSISFLKSLQCGVDVVGVHSSCHLNCYSIHPDGRTVPNFGGWHDAGDLSQFEICTAEMAHAILDLCDEITEEKLKKRLLLEAKVGLEWLLRTRFGDGYRALAVLYGIWRDNVLDPLDKEKLGSKAENGPFENLLASCALARGYELFKEEDNNFANWCKRSAIEDFEFGLNGYKEGIFTKRWGSSIDSVVSGIVVTCACELFKITDNNEYIKIAKEYSKIIMACQETKLHDWDKPLRGFFYEDVNHNFVLYYEHRGHEQTPIQGITSLCELLPNDEMYPLWKNCLDLYKEFVIKSLEYTKPYKLVPNQLFILGKVNKERVTVPSYYGDPNLGMENLDEQIKGGIKLSEGVYLRVFPAAVQRRGYHATLLSKAKGISLISKVLKDDVLMQVAIDQLEWVMGKNPFSSSGMYGEGHNYHPLYVAYSNQMVGALPVGIKTYDNNDLPYWPVIDNAVFKEVWGHTTGKYLWVLADIINYFK